MTSKGKQLPNNLFTLNQSKLDEHLKSDQSSIFDEPSDIDFNENIEQVNREQIDKLNQQIQVYKKQISQLKLKTKELKDALQISELHNMKHQQKQRQLIKKLSHEQITNKQLQFQIKKANQQIIRIKQTSRFSDSRNTQFNNSLKKSLEQRALFIQSFKKIAEAISKCQKLEQFQICVSKFLDFLRKNIKLMETSDKSPQYQLELKFQLGQIGSLKNKNIQLQSKLSKAKQEIEKEKLQKKRIITTFNEKIVKLKNQHDDLKSRVEKKQDQSQFKINTLKKSLNQKIQIINELKYKIDSQKKRKDSICSNKSRIRKKSFYISDGQKQQGQLKMSQLQFQIQNLQRQIIQQLKQ